MTGQVTTARPLPEESQFLGISLQMLISLILLGFIGVMIGAISWIIWWAPPMPTVDLFPGSDSAVQQEQPGQEVQSQGNQSVVATKTSLPITAGEWAKTGKDLPINPRQQLIFDEKRYLFEAGRVSLEADPWFLPKSIGPVPTGGLAWLIADGDAWFGIMIDMACITPCENGEVGSVVRGTDRLIYSIDAGKTLQEFTPPAGESQYRLISLRGPRGEDGMQVFDDGNTVRFYIEIVPQNRVLDKGTVYVQTVAK